MGMFLSSPIGNQFCQSWLVLVCGSHILVVIGGMSINGGSMVNNSRSMGIDGRRMVSNNGMSGMRYDWCMGYIGGWCMGNVCCWCMRNVGGRGMSHNCWCMIGLEYGCNGFDDMSSGR